MDKNVDKTPKTQHDETDFRKLENEGTEHGESGRVTMDKDEESDESGRSRGMTVGRDANAIGGQDPIDPKSPNLIGP